MLVLVRRRGNAFDAVIQALKHANIPVAGADRLKLTEHIAIIDLMNLADALLLPQDDLALAVALKSPLFGLTEDDLFKLAWQRKGSLRTALSQHAATDGRFKDALKRLEECERRFASETPFAFYAWLLGGDGGRQRILNGWATKPTTRWMSFSNSLWAMSARRRPRCRGSWRGCAPPTSK